MGTGNSKSKLAINKNKNDEKINNEKKEKIINNENKEGIINYESDDNNKITMVYLTQNKKKNGVKILGEEFVKNNKQNCKMIINKEEYEICGYITYSQYNINRNDNKLTVVLTGINNCINISNLFRGCTSL